MRLLLVYHGAVLESSRKIFEALAAFKNIRLRVLGPRKGYNPMRNLILEIASPYRAQYDLVSGSVYKATRDFSGPYLTGLLREILLFRPHVIHIFNEAYSNVNIQALLYKHIFRPSAKCYCLGVENIISRTTQNFRQKLVRTFVHRFCNGVACWSMSAKNALIMAGFPREKLKVTYWGIPLDQSKKSCNKSLKEKLGISNKFVVGYCGRFEKEKGLLTLLLALKRLPENYHFLSIGDGSWRDSFFEKANEFGLATRIHWIGRIPDQDVHDYMKAMDVLILPSETTTKWKEQFGRVLPEAMSCGLPIIGSDSGAIPEIVGNAGLIFPEGNSLLLTDAIRKLSSDSRLHNELGKLGIERVTKFFSCEAFVARLISLYLDKDI
ncbi:glycosyltransferase family 4 protein [Thermodesulfobacteriota bacterium]